MFRIVCQRAGGGWKGKNGGYQQKGEAVTGQKKRHDIEADFSARGRLIRDQGAAGIFPLRRPRRALRPTTAFMESEPAGLLPGPPYKPLEQIRIDANRH